MGTARIRSAALRGSESDRSPPKAEKFFQDSSTHACDVVSCEVDFSADRSSHQTRPEKKKRKVAMRFCCYLGRPLVVPTSLIISIKRKTTPLHWICWSLVWQNFGRVWSSYRVNGFSRRSMPVTTRRSFMVTATPQKAVAVASSTAVAASSKMRLDDKSDDLPPNVVTPSVQDIKSQRIKRAKATDEDDEEVELPGAEAKRPRRGRSRKAEISAEPIVASKRRGRPSKTGVAASSDSSGSPTKKKTKDATETGTVKPPADWQEIYALVQELRQDRTAPCDHSGCEAVTVAVADDPRARRFYALVALMLSSQTKDAIVAEAMQKMHDDQVLNPAAMLALDKSQLTDNYLKSVGFRNNKAAYLQSTCKILLDTYDGDIPPTADAMKRLPGVGPKMAHICENVAWNEQSGIGVDTHMHRLLGLLRWVPKNCNTPEKTRLALEAWLPHEYWKDVNLLWVGFGQEVQQEKEKIVKKALVCSQPHQALRLLQRCGMDVRKEAQRYGVEEQVKTVLNNKPKDEEAGNKEES